ncbi:MAG: hypothetical protein ACREJ3_17390 [Polyangiaceae bacterium]
MLRWIGMTVAVTVSAAAAASVVGCSSSSGSSGDSCGKVSACGGSLVGTWKIIDACQTGAAGSGTTSACPGETSSLSEMASGTLTFNADMTYSGSATISVSDTLSIPASCLTSNGVTISCAAFGSFVNSGAGDSGVSNTCNSVGSTCSCAISSSTQNVAEMGTYTTSGNTFTDTPTNGSGSLTMGTSSYCVSGATLHIIGTAMSGANAGMPASDIVAVKQ